jgi:hypothetical protein
MGENVVPEEEIVKGQAESNAEKKTGLFSWAKYKEAFSRLDPIQAAQKVDIGGRFSAMLNDPETYDKAIKLVGPGILAAAYLGFIPAEMSPLMGQLPNMARAMTGGMAESSAYIPPQLMLVKEAATACMGPTFVQEMVEAVGTLPDMKIKAKTETGLNYAADKIDRVIDVFSAGYQRLAQEKNAAKKGYSDLAASISAFGPPPPLETAFA